MHMGNPEKLRNDKEAIKAYLKRNLGSEIGQGF